MGIAADIATIVVAAPLGGLVAQRLRLPVIPTSSTSSFVTSDILTRSLAAGACDQPFRSRLMGVTADQ